MELYLYAPSVPSVAFKSAPSRHSSALNEDPVLFRTASWLCLTGQVDTVPYAAVLVPFSATRIQFELLQAATLLMPKQDG